MKKISFFVVLLLHFLVSGSFIFAQEKPSPTWASFRQAKQVLDAGINALGGTENIRRAGKISINYKAVNHPVGQNAAFSAPPAEFIRIGAKTLIDYSGNHFINEGQSNSPGGYKFNFRNVISPKRSFSIDLLKNRRGDEVRNIGEQQKAQFKVGLLSEAPHLLLLYASQRPETLRYLGEAEIDGRKLRAISFVPENAAQMTLYFDARTDLLTRTEQLTSIPQLGDAVTGNIFSDYRQIGSVKIPSKRLGFVNQFITSENEYADVRLDFADGEKLLDVPAGFVESSTSQATANAEVMRKMGDGVYLIERIGAAYRVMFVEFDDYIMILEAPTDSDVTKAIIKSVKQIVPNKPIKYVSFSHFHIDHTGGLREYIAAGATIVVPPGNKNFVEQIAKSKFTLKPDALASNPRQPVIETFDKKRAFTDGKRLVELHNIGRTSHVDDMTMFYFPKEKILFQGDMFSQLDQGGIPPIIEVNYELAKKVDELKLDVETLIGVHSGALPWKDFLTAVGNSAKK